MLQTKLRTGIAHCQLLVICRQSSFLFALILNLFFNYFLFSNFSMIQSISYFFFSPFSIFGLGPSSFISIRSKTSLVSKITKQSNYNIIQCNIIYNTQHTTHNTLHTTTHQTQTGTRSQHRRNRRLQNPRKRRSIRRMPHLRLLQ